MRERSHMTWRTPERATRFWLVLVALLGTWLGHTLEYLRTRGPTGLVRAMTRPVHLYMTPMGGVLIVVIGACMAIWLRAAGALARRLDVLRTALRTGQRVAPERTRRRSWTQSPSRSPLSPLLGLWLTLAFSQLALYLIQENVEAHLVGLRGPGLGAMLGSHWAVAPIHLALAAALAAAVTSFTARFRRLAHAVEAHEELVRRLWARPLSSGVAPRPPRAITPHERWGAQLWARPPPVPVAA